VHAQPSSSFVARRRTCDFPLTFQTLVRKLQNLGNATGAGLLNLLKFSARYWWVEATSEWRLIKHSADGHWSNNWSVTI